MTSDKPTQQYLFEIGVYRLSLDAWLEERERERSQAVRRMTTQGATERSAEAAASWGVRYQCWEYNQIVGWIRLLWDGPGPVVKAYLWQVGVSAHRAQRRFDHRFRPFPFLSGNPSHKLFEEWFDRDTPDADIYRRLLAQLRRTTKPGGDVERMHVDLEAFETVGPHTGWAAAIGIGTG